MSQPVLIYMCLDASTSMAEAAPETISGVNQLLSDHREKNPDGEFTLLTFSTFPREFTYRGIKMKDMPDITADDYVCQGWTALYDSIDLILNLPHQPGKHILIIVSDGIDNRSTKTAADIKRQIEFKKLQGWSVILMGFQLDQAVDIGREIGVQNAFTYQMSDTPHLFRQISQAATDPNSEFKFQEMAQLQRSRTEVGRPRPRPLSLPVSRPDSRPPIFSPLPPLAPVERETKRPRRDLSGAPAEIVRAPTDP